MKKISLLLLSFITSSSLYAQNDKYTISVCMTSNMENALTCKKRIYDYMQGEVFIVKDRNNKYFTYLNVYDNKYEAQNSVKTASSYVKSQGSYAKKLDDEILSLKINNKDFIDLNEKSKDNIKVEETVNQKIDTTKEVVEKKEPVKQNEEFPLVSTVPKMEELKFVSNYPYPEGKKFDDEHIIEQKKEEVKETQKEETKVEPKIEYKAEEKTEQKIEPKVEEEIRQISMKEFDEAPKKEQKVEKVEVPKEKLAPLVSDYEEIIIEVNSVTNNMNVKAKINNELKDIKTYRVSTGKNDIKKPFGTGKITQISLNPVWYPTEDTLRTFRKRGIYLPSMVPAGHKYNYMGAAKINLTHVVDGKNTFRIHGTLNESTIGTNESSGCIRMKNADVLQLASMLNQFSNKRSLDEIKVILK